MAEPGGSTVRTRRFDPVHRGDVLRQNRVPLGIGHLIYMPGHMNSASLTPELLYPYLSERWKRNESVGFVLPAWQLGHKMLGRSKHSPGDVCLYNSKNCVNW